MNHKGQEAVEFILIGTLIFLAALFTFIMFGNKLTAFFESDSSVMKTSSQKPPVTDPSKPLKYNPDYETFAPDMNSPLYKKPNGYTGGYHELSIGDYTFSDLPDDFNEYVKGNGVSGGTELLSTLLLQIAEKLEREDYGPEANDIRRLSNFGHNIAAIQEEVEKMVQDCKYEDSCITNHLNNVFPVPENYDSSISSLGADIRYTHAIDSSIIGDETSYLYNKNREDYNGTPIVVHYTDLWNSIKDNPNIPDDAKGLVDQISRHLGSISMDFHNSTDVKDGKGSAADLRNYNAPQITNLDSSLICATGQGEDSGIHCE
jgi:hypothetical protein